MTPKVWLNCSPIIFAGVLQLEGGEGLGEEMEGGRDEDAKSSMESEGNEDDVVHCVCGSEVDEGFMIQVGYWSCDDWFTVNQEFLGVLEKLSKFDS